MVFALCAGVAELADAPDSKSGDSDIVWVRAPPPVPINYHHTDYNQGEGEYYESGNEQYYSYGSSYHNDLFHDDKTAEEER